MTSFALRTSDPSQAAFRATGTPRVDIAGRGGGAELFANVRALKNPPAPGSLALQYASAAGEGDLSERLAASLFEALSHAKILTSQVAMHLDTEWRQRLFRQLDSLHDASEWEPGDMPIQKASFSTFLKAILHLNPPRPPGFGLTGAGNLIAAWTAGIDRLTIEFMPRERVRWVLSQHRTGEDTDRFAGETGVAHLSESLAPYHPESWFGNDDKNSAVAR